MTDFGDFIAHGVVMQALVCEGDETLEDLGIMSLEPGQVILKCKGAERIDPDSLFSVPGFTPNGVVRGLMLEYNEWIERAAALMLDMRALLDETCDTYYEQDYHAICERLREFGIGGE